MTYDEIADKEVVCHFQTQREKKNSSSPDEERREEKFIFFLPSLKGCYLSFDGQSLLLRSSCGVYLFLL